MFSSNGRVGKRNARCDSATKRYRRRNNRVPVVAQPGPLNDIPCRHCALHTGLCFRKADETDGCWNCLDIGHLCEELPNEAIDCGKAITVAMDQNAPRFTTRLLTEKLKSILRSLPDSDTEEEEEEEEEEEAEIRSEASHHDGIEEELGEGPINNREVREDGPEGDCIEIADSQTEAPLDDIEARRPQLERILEVMIDNHKKQMGMIGVMMRNQMDAITALRDILAL